MKTQMPSIHAQFRPCVVLLLLSSMLVAGCAGGRKLSFSRMWGPDRFRMKTVGRKIADWNPWTEAADHPQNRTDTSNSRGDKPATKAGQKTAETRQQPEATANKAANGKGRLFASFSRKRHADKGLLEDPFLAAHEQPELKQDSVPTKVSAAVVDDVSRPIAELTPFADLANSTPEEGRQTRTSIAPPTKPNPFADFEHGDHGKSVTAEVFAENENPFADFSSNGDRPSVLENSVPSPTADPFVGDVDSQLERLRSMMKDGVGSIVAFDTEHDRNVNTKRPLQDARDRLKRELQSGDSERMTETTPTAKRPAGKAWTQLSLGVGNSSHDNRAHKTTQVPEWARPELHKQVEPLETVLLDFQNTGHLAKKKNSGKPSAEPQLPDELPDIKIVPTPRNRIVRTFGHPAIPEDDSFRVEFLPSPPQQEDEFRVMIVESDAVPPSYLERRTADGDATVHTNLLVPARPVSDSAVRAPDWTAPSSNRGRSLEHEPPRTGLNGGNFSDIGSSPDQPNGTRREQTRFLEETGFVPPFPTANPGEPPIPAAEPNKGEEPAPVKPSILPVSSATDDSAETTLGAVNFDAETEPGTDSAVGGMISPTTIGLGIGVLSLIGLLLRRRTGVRGGKTL